MDRRERSGEAMTSMLAAMEGWQAGIQTALPGIIQSFNAAKRTVVIQPAVQAQVQDPSGAKTWVTLPLLLDCPVIFPGGGGVTLTFPLKAGDECLVVFANRCIDNWWQSGQPSPQAEMRMHDLSDGFCIAGVSSVPKVIPAISNSTSQLRDNAGTTFIEVDPAGAVTITTPGAVTVNAATVAVNASTLTSITAPNIGLVGAVSILGSLSMVGAGTIAGSIDVSGDVVANGISLHDHVHADAHGGNTSPPL